MALKNIHSDNINELIFVNLNINSISKKFEFLGKQVKGKIDTLIILETKIKVFTRKFLKGTLMQI